MIRRDRAREKDERRIAISLRQIAEDLIVGAVFFDDIDDVLERRIVSVTDRWLVPIVSALGATCELLQFARLHFRGQRSDGAV